MKRIRCMACALVPSQAKAQGRQIKCHECNDVGFIEVNDTKCSHLPPNKISFDPMVSGWECQCGASGPWNHQYDEAYEAAIKSDRQHRK